MLTGRREVPEMFGQTLCRPLNLISIWINLPFIFHFMFMSRAEFVRLPFSERGDRSNCGLNLRVKPESDERIRVSRPAPHRVSFFKGKQRHSKYCDLFITSSAADHLIELEWWSNSSGRLQPRSNPNQSVLVISPARKANGSLVNSSMQASGSLIGRQRLVVRVPSGLVSHLDDDLVIKVNSLKIIRLEFQELASRPAHKPYCVNIGRSLVDLDLSSAESARDRTAPGTAINKGNVLNDANDATHATRHINLSIAAASQDCVRINLKTFHNSRLIAKKELDVCDGHFEPIAVIGSTNIELKAVNASGEASLCLSFVGSARVDVRTGNDSHKRPFLTKKKLKLKRHLRPFEMFAFHLKEEDNDQIDNCFEPKDDSQGETAGSSAGQASSSIRCYVLFESIKLDFENADQFCKKALLPYEYAEVGLANLSSSHDLDFVKQFVHR